MCKGLCGLEMWLCRSDARFVFLTLKHIGQMHNHKTTQQFQQEINKLQAEVKKLKARKKYGLVWEEKEEQVILDCQDKLPILKEVKSKEIKTDDELPVNILIEGDNYHSLSVLSYTHREKIDVIYIDPPYNTGNASWRYNNKIIDSDDSFKHSKFASFINSRLRLAKNLLSPNGIIIFTIDDYEIHTCRLLLDEIFGENNRLGTAVIVHNPRGRNDDQYFATMHEYALFYSKNNQFAKIKKFEFNEESLEKQFPHSDSLSQYGVVSFMRTGNNSDRHTRPNLFYPIYWDGHKLSLKKSKGAVEVLPINEKGEEKTWRWSQDTFAKSHETEILVKKVKGTIRLFKKRRPEIVGGTKPKTIWYDPKYDASSHGVVLLDKLFSKRGVFPYPKSLHAVIDSIFITSNKNSTVLDFFAGSGTTGHAVLELNKKDGGNRKFILCTNNENEICEEVTYPRVKKIITGYKDANGKKVDGLGGNLKYYKTAFVDTEHIAKISDESKIKLTYQVGEMIALRENVLDEIEKNDWWQIFANDNKQLAIYFEEDKKKLQTLVAKLNKENKSTILYIFSWGKNEYKNEFADYKNIRVEDIPEPILAVYKEINKL